MIRCRAALSNRTSGVCISRRRMVGSLPDTEETIFVLLVSTRMVKHSFLEMADAHEPLHPLRRGFRDVVGVSTSGLTNSNAYPLPDRRRALCNDIWLH